MKVLITGSSGLIGSEAAVKYGRQGWTVHGIDNNQRRRFFGPQGDTTWNLQCLMAEVPGSPRQSAVRSVSSSGPRSTLR